MSVIEAPKPYHHKCSVFSTIPNARIEIKCKNNVNDSFYLFSSGR